MPAKKSTPASDAAPATPAAAKKAAAKKAPAKKAAAAQVPATTAPAPKSPAAAAPALHTQSPATPSQQEIAQAAFLNYRSRKEKGLPGDQHGDWLEAERRLKGK